MILLDEKDALLSRGSVAASVLGKSKSIPWTTSGFAEHAALYEKLNGKKVSEQERRAGWPGWLVFITLRGND
jgi:hypothetical protein